MESQITILAIESSCDDTSAAVLQDRKVLSNLIANQEIHASFGGVVPELASREHQKNMIPVVQLALDKANIDLNEIDAIAYTIGPGLLGSLLVGSSFAKGLSLSLNKPLIEVNHMEAHILAHFIENNEYDTTPRFPFMCLTVSGGHTQIVLLEDYNKMTVIGQTQDDAAGEAFDKIAKIMGLPYPGGPLIDRLAKKGNPKKFRFPKGKMPGYDFSFSGLKTAVLYFLRKEIKKNENFIEENKEDICASIQFTIVDTLLQKFFMAAEKYEVKDLAIAGGVSANSALRESLATGCKERNLGCFIPNFEYCTDNAAMIGIAGYFKFLEKDTGDFSHIPKARLLI